MKKPFNVEGRPAPKTTQERIMLELEKFFEMHDAADSSENFMALLHDTHCADMMDAAQYQNIMFWAEQVQTMLTRLQLLYIKQLMETSASFESLSGFEFVTPVMLKR